MALQTHRPACAAWFLFAASLIATAPAALAQVPATFNYQGRLTDLSGVPIDTSSSGPITVEFLLYDDPSATSAVWQEGQQVDVTDGLFQVALGSSTPLPLPFDEPYWLEVVVDGDLMGIRLPLHSVPYSLHADSADFSADAALLGGTPASELEESAEITDAVAVHASDPEAHHPADGFGEDLLPDSVTSVGDISSFTDIVAGGDLYSVGNTDVGGDLIVSGNLGIGTPAPVARAEIVDSGDIGAYSLASASLLITDLTEVLALDADQLVTNSAFYLDVQTGGHHFRTGGSERLTILDNGNVGVGHTYPGFRLEVGSGALHLADPDLVIGHESSYVASAERAWILANTGGSRTLRLLVNNDGQVKAEVELDNDDAASGMIKLKTSDGAGLTERLRVTATGEVGIGTTAPAYALDVAGPIRVQGNVIRRDDGTAILAGTADRTKLVADGSGRHLSLFSGGSAAADERVRVTASGDVGVGTTTPAYRLDVAGPIRVQGNVVRRDDGTAILAGTADQTKLVADGSGRHLSLYSGGSAAADEHVRITAEGDVGIGTTSPDAQLHVTGDALLGAGPGTAIAFPDPALPDHAQTGTPGTIGYWLDQFSATGGTVFLRPGTYDVAGSLVVHSNVTIRGSGPNSVIQATNPSGGHIIRNPPGSSSATGVPVSHVSLEDFAVQGTPGLDSNCIVIKGNSSTHNEDIYMRGLHVEGCEKHGIHVKYTTRLIMSDLFLRENGDSNLEHNLYVFDVTNALISGVVSTASGGHGFNANIVNGLSITNFVSRVNDYRGFRIAAAERVTLDGVSAINNGSGGIVLTTYDINGDGNTQDSEDVDDAAISGCLAKGNDGNGIMLTSPLRVTITGCSIYDNDGYGIEENGSNAEVVVGNIIVGNGSGAKNNTSFTVFESNHAP